MQASGAWQGCRWPRQIGGCVTGNADLAALERLAEVGGRALRVEVARLQLGQGDARDARQVVHVHLRNHHALPPHLTGE